MTGGISSRCASGGIIVAPTLTLVLSMIDQGPSVRIGRSSLITRPTRLLSVSSAWFSSRYPLQTIPPGSDDDAAARTIK